MKSIIKLILSFFLILGSASIFACDYPEKISIPDGNSATKLEMVTTMNNVKAWVKAIEDYQICIEKEEQSSLALLKINGELTPEVTTNVQDLTTRKFNAAVEDMEKTSAEFNAQVRAFNAKGN